MLLLLAPAAQAATVRVPYDAPTLDDALLIAAPGDVIDIDPGTWDAPASIGIDVTLRGVAPGVTVQGSMALSGAVGIEDLTLDGLLGSRVLEVGGLTVLDRVAVTNGTDTAGGLVLVRSGGQLVATDSTFAGGSATDSIGFGGGAILVQAGGIADLTGGAVSGNTSASDGGGITALGSLTLTDVVLDANAASLSGGAVMARDGADVAVLRGRFCGNDAGTDAGGLYLFFAAPSTVDNVVFQDNAAQDDGGGLRTRNGDLVVRHTTFVGNDSTDNGAALSARALSGANTLLVSDTLFAISSGGGATAALDSGEGITTTLVDSAFWDVPGGGDWRADITPIESGTLSGIDPELAGYTPGDCDSDLTLLWTSPLRDAGSDLDPLGDPADIGAFGGPSADPALWVDADLDAVPIMWDCDDAEPLSFPDNPEVCDFVDNDCDGTPDDGLPTSPFFRDTDLDGHGTPVPTMDACMAPPGFAALDDDCDDSNPDRFPGNPEVCDELDNDCDAYELVDDGLPTTIWYEDADDDGYGNALMTFDTCLSSPEGWSADATDCNDDDPAISPGATDIAGNGVDEDCDGYDAVVEPTDTGTSGTGTGSTGTGTGSTGTGSTGAGSTGTGTGDDSPPTRDFDDEEVPAGCTCDSGSRSLVAPWLLLLGFARRRREPC